MSLVNSINIFIKKYKKPLTILVLLFFIYKVFNYYYGNIYEGFEEATATAAELREMANVTREKADYQSLREQELKLWLMTVPDENQEAKLGLSDGAMRANAKAIKLNLEADRLDKLANERFDEATSTATELREMANVTRKHALYYTLKEQKMEQFLMTTSNENQEAKSFYIPEATAQSIRANAKANKLNLEADRLDNLADKAEAEVAAKAKEAAAKAEAEAEAEAEAAKAEAPQIKGRKRLFKNPLR